MSKSKDILVKTFEEACAKEGIDPLSLPIVDSLPLNCQAAIIAHYKLIVIAKALNEAWVPNWKDRGEYKYYPWFEMDKSGFGFSFGGFGCVSGASSVGSRLVFRTRALAEYAGKQFLNLYKDYLTIP